MFISLLANSVFCQSAKVSIHLNNSTVEEILNEIENKSEYYFLFNQKLIDVNRKIDFKAEDISIKEILDSLFIGQGVEYMVIDRQIILVPGKEFANKDNRRIDVSGTISDQQTGELLSGVNIINKENYEGTITDSQGNYILKNISPNATLVCKYLGYKTEEILLQGNTTMNIQLTPEVQELEEVIVIGYGFVKKRDITGSISSISRENMNSGHADNVNSLIQNKTPGALFLKDDSQPGAGYTIRIRGASSQLATNQPLFVVDGLPLDYGNIEPGTVSFTGAPSKDGLNAINPNDILSVEILKDASATAIYGSRGANGVIMITTKKGEKGGLKADYLYSASLQKEFRLFKMMNAFQYADLFNKYVDYTGQNLIKYTDAELEEVKRIGKGTNWQKEIQRKYGRIQDHMLSLCKGNDDLNFYISLGYTDYKGLVKETGINRYTGKVSIDSRPDNAINLGLNINSSFTKSDQIHQESDEFGPQYNGVFTARQWAPIWPVRNTDGTYFLHPVTPWIPNPVSNLEIDDRTNSFRSLGTLWMEYEFIKNFKAKIEIGGDIQDAKRGSYIPTSVVVGRQQGGIAEISDNTKLAYLGNILLNYNKTFKADHYADAMFGFSYQNFYEEGFNANQTGFPTDAFRYYNLGAGAENQRPWSFKLNHKLISSFTRFNYHFRDKYLITLTVRADGSTRFGKNNKWGYFPSIAGAWKLHNEEAIKNLNLFTQLKLRASYGLSGNQEFPSYLSLPLLESTTLPIGQVVVTGIKLNRASNPNLRWETTKQLNFGIDFGFLENRITGTLDWYHKLTYNLLQNFTVPRSTGFDYITANNGAVLNKGLELEISSLNTTGKVRRETSFNFSYNKNKWKDRGNSQYGIEEEFGPLGGTYGYIVEGIFKSQNEAISEGQPLSTAGQYNFKDVRGVDNSGKIVNTPDGKIDGNDRVLLGYYLPQYSLGLQNKLFFKNFDLSVFIQGMFGQKKTGGIASLFNISTIIQEQRTNLPVEFYSLINDDGTFDYNNQYQLNDGTANVYGGTPNSITVEDASFIRLRNISLGYSLPSRTLKRIRNLRFSVDAQNLILTTRYSGYNPENNSALYPDVRTFSVAVNIGF
jgi:TonB-linked SusC/RagA family outer membrane protein